MKHCYKLLASMLMTAMTVSAQIPNGDFETWTTIANNWHLANFRSGSEETPQLSRYQPAYSGNYSVKLMNLTTQDPGQTGVEATAIFGSWANDPFKGNGGFPFSQKPTKLYVYAQYNMLENDSASICLTFKKNGAVITDYTKNTFLINGSYTGGYKKLTFDITGLTETPDTIIYTIASANFKEYINTGAIASARNGSYIIVDKISFDTGDAPYGDFEEWGRPVEIANNWLVWGGYEVTLDCNATNPIQKTTDSHSGKYAMVVSTYYNQYDNGNGVMTGGSTGDYIYNQSQTFPCSVQKGFLNGWFKYYPKGSDTAQVNIILYKNGQNVGYAPQKLYANSTYTNFSIPFECSETPDAAEIQIFSSCNKLTEYIGSKLYLDDMSISAVNASGWQYYDGSLTPDLEGWARASTASVALPTNTSIADLGNGNKYLHCVSDSSHVSQYRFGTQSCTANRPLTVMFRAKSDITATNNRLGGYFEIDLGAPYKNIVVKLKNVVNGRNVGVTYINNTTVSTPCDISQWHIYRLTYDGTNVKLYVDENSTPVITGLPDAMTTTKTTSYLLRIVSSSLNNMSTGDIDWIAWNQSGAFAPGEGVLPSTYVQSEVASDFNGDFEFWQKNGSYNIPTGPWANLNDLSDGSFYPVSMSTDAYSGSYSLMVQNSYPCPDLAATPYKFGALFTTAKGTHAATLNQDLMFHPGIKRVGHPTKLTGYYKFTQGSTTSTLDTWRIQVDLYKSGVGVNNSSKSVTGNTTVNEWTYFEIPLADYADANVDSLGIVINSCLPYDGVNGSSTLLVDNLKLEDQYTAINAGLWKALTGGSSNTKTWKLDINTVSQASEYFHNPLDFYGDATAGGSSTNIWGPWGGTNLFGWGMAPEIGTITFDAKSNQVTLKLEDGVNADGFQNKTNNGDGTYSLHPTARVGTFTGTFTMTTQARDASFLTLSNGLTLWQHMLQGNYSYLQSLSDETASLSFSDGLRFPIDKANLGNENFESTDLRNVMIMHCSENALIVRIKRTYNGVNSSGLLKPESCWHLYNFVKVASNSTSVAEQNNDQPSIIAQPDNLLFTATATTVSIYNINGQAIKSANKIEKLTTADLKQGVYIVKAIFTNGSTATLKFVK